MSAPDPRDADPAAVGPGRSESAREVAGGQAAGREEADSELAQVEQASSDVRAERLLLERAIGGWQGVVDSGLPTLVFVVVFLITGSDAANLRYALGAAIGIGVLILLWRVIRRERVQQVIAGFVGLAISAWFASRTGRAEDYFVRGLVTNAAYGLAFAISLAVRWPLIGVAMGLLTGEGTRWRQDAVLRRAYSAATWIWVGLFVARLAVQLPLYFTKQVAALGVMNILMGWPLFLAAAYLTYRLLAPIYRERRAVGSGDQAGPEDADRS